jgi:hypothetical protein
VTFCYCGNRKISECVAGFGEGACRTEIEQGLKSTDPTFILLNLTNPTRPGGGALSLGQCDHDNCGDPALGGDNSCVPYCAPVDVVDASHGQDVADASAGHDAPDVSTSADSADVALAQDAAGEADARDASVMIDAGADGDVAESSTKDVVDAGQDGGICSAPLRDNAALCSACEDNFCPHDSTGCSSGACAFQPFCSDYLTQADQARCSDVLTCIRTTNCIANGVTFCYCGTTTLSACSAGSGNGACKSVVEAGSGQTTPTNVLLNLTNPRFPSGGAMSLGQCDHDNCGDPAFGGANECIPYCK